MYARLISGTLAGCTPFKIEVEVDIAGGLPGFSVVGLPDLSVSEAKDRVRAAIRNSKLKLPSRRITVNLAPADVKKEGTGLDLPIAMALLTAAKIIPKNALENILLVAELSLDGKLRHTTGILPLALLAKEASLKGILLSKANAREAQVVPGLKVFAFESLEEIVSACLSGDELTESPASEYQAPPPLPSFRHFDLAEIKGQTHARRVLEISAAGGHNLLMSGPPGAGKTLLARCLPSILPPLEFEEAVEVTRIYSVKGLLPPGAGLMETRPFRDPHHTISDVALIGGGRNPSPGEVSLAHHGVLFLDEIPEYRKSVLEVLREPLSEGHVSISRAMRTVAFPARFQLLAAMNPCPCGFLTDDTKKCNCTRHQIQGYQQRLSGPLLDRIDLQISVPRLSPEELIQSDTAESSDIVRQRVIAARERQRKRHPRSKIFLNSHISIKTLRTDAPLSSDCTALLLAAVRKFGLSARAYDKITRVARTIADLHDQEEIATHHIAEAVQYRTQQPFGAPGQGS